MTSRKIVAKRQLPKIPKITLFDTENGVVRPEVLEAIKVAEEEYARVKKELGEKKPTEKKDMKLPITNPFKCTRCNLHLSKGHHYVLPSGDPHTAKIVIVGEAPGAQESIEGKPFVGKSGQLLRQVLAEVGISETDICITNVVLCRPPGNRQPTIDEINFCRPYFNWFLEQCKNVRVIVPLGGTALQATLGLQKIMDKRGSMFRKEDRVYIPTFHPAAVLRNMNYYSTWANDFKTINQFATGVIEKGTYKLIETLEMANKIFDRLEQTDLFALDLETSTDNPNDEISQFTRDEILGISFSWLEKTGVYLPLCNGLERVWAPDVERYLIDRLKKVCSRPEVKIVFANGKFDVKFLKRQFDLDLFSEFETEKIGDSCFPRFKYYFDVQYAHHLIWERPPHDLKALSKMFPDLAYYEAELNEYKTNHNIKNYRNIPVQIIYKYAASDADATLRLYNRFAPKLKELGLEDLFFKITMPLACILAGAEYAGVQIDKEEISRLAPILEQELKQKEASIYALAGEKFNIRSSKQLKTILLDKLKIPLPIKKTGKKDKQGNDVISLDREVLETSDHPLVTAILDYRDTYKEYTTYIVNLSNGLDQNNRLHASFNITGSETGRLCLHKDSLIVTDKGTFKIAELPLTEGVYNVMTHKKRYKRILDKFYKGKEMLYTVELTSGVSITCTKGHRFLTPKGWKHLYELSEGSSIKESKKTGTKEFITSRIKSIKEYGVDEVWDIEVEDDHSYICQGFINHNSSSGPNLQNIPRGDKLRSLFVSKPGYSLVVADYSQIELRVMAFYSQDSALLEAFRKGEDIHTAVAQKVFKTEKITKEQRHVAKSINFGLIYGRGAPSLAKEIGCTVEEAQSFIDRYFENMYGVREYRKNLIEAVRVNKEVRTIFNRRRHLPEIVSEDKEVRGHAERQALNMPIQSTAADCTNLSTVLTHLSFKILGIDAQLVLSVHDEIVFEVRNEHVPKAVKYMHKIMKSTAEEKLDLPVEVSIFVNNKWVEFDSDKDPQGQDDYLRSIGINATILQMKS